MLKSATASASAVLIITLLAGCSDPKEANEANFKKAAQAYLDTVYPRCHFSQKLPTTVTYTTGSRHDVLPKLAKAGLLTEKVLSRKEVSGWLVKEKQMQVESTFELSDEGRKYYKEPAAKSFFDGKGGFCAGKAEVREITRFTEPADIMGHRIAKVNYTYTVSDLPDWARSAELREADRALDEDAGADKQAVKRVEDFVLTNNGWIHSRMFND